MMLPMCPFASWDEVLKHVQAKHPIWYQAPLDPRPTRLTHLMCRQHWRKVWIYVNPIDGDSFMADSGHLSRFRKLA